MPTLLLLNGPPASGKSTLAARLVELNPLALNLDIDVIRGQLGDWLAQPAEAGLVARSLALAMAVTHLGAGHDVVVPQFLGQVDFIEQLEKAASRADATFVEIVLHLDRDDALRAFDVRSENPENQTHRDAALLVAKSRSADPVGEMYDSLQRLSDQRPSAQHVMVEIGDIDSTFTSLLQALEDLDVSWKPI